MVKQSMIGCIAEHSWSSRDFCWCLFVLGNNDTSVKFDIWANAYESNS